MRHYVIDFGLTRVMNGHATTTKEATMPGTLTIKAARDMAKRRHAHESALPLPLERGPMRDPPRGCDLLILENAGDAGPTTK